MNGWMIEWVNEICITKDCPSQDTDLCNVVFSSQIGRSKINGLIEFG